MTFPFPFVPVAGEVVQISQAAGTNIGTMVDAGGLAAAFDGTTAQAAAACAVLAGGGGAVGKNYGSARNVVRWRVWGSSDAGFHNEAVNAPGSLVLQRSPDGSAWTTVDTYTTVSIAASAAGIDRTFASVGAYQYWRVLCPAAGDSRLAELQLWEQT